MINKYFIYDILEYDQSIFNFALVFTNKDQMALKTEFATQGNFLFRYRSYFPIMLLPLAAWVIYLQRGDAIFESSSLLKLEYLAIIICTVGLIIRIITVGFTPANTSGRNTAQGQVADTVNTQGMYSLVRHPLYVGNFFMWLGIAVLTANFWFILSFIFAYWLYYERIMYAEEDFLTTKFGSRYTDWTAVTPAFIPRLGGWKGSDLTFSIKKVLKKEKNGLFAIFLLVWIFDIYVNYLKSGQFIVFTTHLFWLMALTGVTYFILKVIKKYTNILDEEGR